MLDAGHERVDIGGNPFRSLEGEFHDAEGPTDTSMAVGAIQTILGAGTSSVAGPALDLLQRLMQNSLNFAREMIKLYLEARLKQGKRWERCWC